MPRCWGLTALLLAAVLCGSARANINDDRIAARTACYKACLSRDGYDPVCVINPNFPNETTHGGGEMVWPNECTAKCMETYAKYAEYFRLDVKYHFKPPSRCYKQVWDIYIGLTVDAPECEVCNPKAKVAKPSFKAIPQDQCMKGCVERDGWQPLCVQDFLTKKKVAFGNGCAAECSGLLPTPLYNVKLPDTCKNQFLKTGQFSSACSKCPKGRNDDNLFIDNDRQVARQFCYKACISRDGWDPVCSWNPKYPNQTTHGGGDSVWPNECTAKCMSRYCKYDEQCNLRTKYKIKLPAVCKQDLFKIYYITANPPSAPQSVIKKCTTCPPPS